MAFAEPSASSYVVDFLSTSEGLQLNRAFAIIRDPKVRKRSSISCFRSPRNRQRFGSVRSIKGTNFLQWLDQTNAACQKRRLIVRSGAAGALAKRQANWRSGDGAPELSVHQRAFPKAIPTRSATASPTRWWTCSSAKAPRTASTPANPRRLRDPGHHQPRRHRRRDARPRPSASPRIDRGVPRAGDQGHRLRAGRLPLAERQGRSAAARPVRRTSPRASTPPATRTRARATRASCSAMPAARRRS